MKKVLILILSSQHDPYKKMMGTSLNTWDKIQVDGVESVYYCGLPLQWNTEKIIYFDIPENYNNLGYKTLMAFDWALNNKEFDYVARVNASTYVNKKELIKYVQTLPDENLFSGLVVEASEEKPRWLWGPQFILSKDVVSKLAANRQYIDRDLMEDQGISYLGTKLGIPLSHGISSTIDKMYDNTWRLMSYGMGDSFEFERWEDMKKAEGQFFIRVKQDYDRNVDEYVMEQLYKVFK